MREYCQECYKAKNACYCHKIVSLNNTSHILILQHPNECKHPLNSARIAELSFKNCRIIIGEDFSQNKELNEILKNDNCCLLFPSDDAQKVSHYSISCKDAPEGKKPTLILIDGTWRKAKKIFYLSKNLHSIPKICLSSNYKSRYRIRKQPTNNYLSTLEALTYSLNILENNDFTSVFEAFDYLIEFQIKKMGQQVYLKNY